MYLATLAGLGFLYSWLWGLNRADELWFFYLAKLTAEGQLPYVDFVFHVFPAGLYLTAAGLLAFGHHVFVLKALVAVIFALTAGLTWKVLQLLRGQSMHPALVYLPLLLLSPPLPGAAYGPFAYLFLVAALLASLRALAAPSWRRWLAAGWWAGLAVGGKYNVGLLAAASVLGAAWVGGRWRRLYHLAAGTAGIAVAVVVNLLPVWMSGGWTEFSHQVFATKGFYLKGAAALPLQGTVVHDLPRPVVLTTAENALRLGLRAAGYLTVALGALALVRLWHERRGQRPTVGVVGVFLAAATAGAFPRFDSEHVLPVVPVAVVPLLLLYQPRGRSRWRAGAAAVALGLVGLTFLLPVSSLLAGVWQPAQLPHLTGARIAGPESQAIEAIRTFAKHLAPDQPVLFIGPYAAFYYLVSGRTPPTPHLSTLLSELGTVGQAQLIGQLQRGEIHWVCLQRWPWALRPATLEEFVTTHLTPHGEGGECSWWHNPNALSPVARE